MPEVWRLIELSAPEDPVWNMALDTALLDARADAVPTLRFYRWSRPALSIGYFQNVEKTTRVHGRADSSVPVVRRPTGGGMVPHGKDLTFSLTLPEDHPRFAGGVSDSYRAVHAVILAALMPVIRELAFSGCDAPLSARGRDERVCFDEPVSCDIEWQGRKVVGSSQRRKNGRLLHQTSVHLSLDAGEMALRITRAFEAEWDVALHPSPVTAEEMRSASAIRTSVYGSADWAFDPPAKIAAQKPVFP